MWHTPANGWRCFLAGPTGFDRTKAIAVLDGSDPFEANYQMASPFDGGNQFTSDVVPIDAKGTGRESLVMFFPSQPGVPARGIGIAQNNSADNFRLVGATDGLGAKLEITYGAIANNAIYTSGVAVSYPIRETRRMTVVTEVKKDNGGNFASEFEHFLYQYAGARTDVSGRGFLGFHSFVTMDVRTNLFKYQFLTQSFPMTGLTAREETYRDLGGGNFRFLSSHTNSVVFDEVVNPAGSVPWGTVFPFISQAVEYRWEDDTTAHFSLGAAIETSQPEALFPQVKPMGEHIKITAQSWFDLQATPPAGQTTIPAVQTSISGGVFYPSDTKPDGTNAVAGTAYLAAALPGTSTTAIESLQLPRKITYGNLVQLKTDFGDGHSETVVNAYESPTSTGLTGRLHSVDTTVGSTIGGTEKAPKKTYTYWGNTMLVASEAIDPGDAKLATTTTYDRDGDPDHRGRVKSTTIGGYTDANDWQAIGTYEVSGATAFDNRFDRPTTTTGAAPYLYKTAITYDPWLGLETSVTDMENGSGTNRPQTTTAYDALGRVTQKKDTFKGLETNTTYALTGGGTDWTASVTVTGPAGHTGTSVAGVVALSLTSAYAVQTTAARTATGATYAPTVWTYFDRLGRTIRTVKENFSGKTATDTVYNSLGQIIAVSVPYVSGSGTPTLWTKTTYDRLGRVSAVTAPNGTVTTTTYQGRATKVAVQAATLGGVTPAAQTNATLVDAKGRTVAVWNADNVPTFTDTLGATTTGASVAFALDGFGRMRTTTLRGQTSQPITATYDGLGRQLTLNDPDKGNWQYLNNAVGEVVWQKDAKLTETTTRYDNLGRPLTRTTTEAAGAVETAKWYYYGNAADATLHLTAATGTAGSWVGAAHYDEVATAGAPGYGAGATAHIHYYDTLGRPEIELTQIDGQHFYTKTAYDDYSRPQTVWPAWRPNGENPGPVSNWGYTYVYDAKGYVTQVKDTDATPRIWWNTPTYDHLDRVVSAQKGNGYYTQRTYRPEDGVLTAIKTGTSVGGTGLQNLGYNWDGLGNLTTRTAPAAGGGTMTETFGYDSLNRLTTRTAGGTTTTLATYADNGNITTKLDVTGAASGTYGYTGPRPHAVTSAWGWTLGYDANGNVVTRTKTGEAWSFAYPGFDKPRWMAKTAGTATVGAEFAYDAGRSRVLHLDFDSMAGGTPLHYTKKKVYTAGAAAEVDYTISGDGTTWVLDRTRAYVPAPDGTVGAMVFKGTAGTAEAEVYHQDHLGSIDVITPYGDTGGAPQNDRATTPAGGRPSRYSYEPWGERRDPVAWAGRPTTTTHGGGDDLIPRGFTGHEMLDDLGLVHMNGRIYDPVLGRMLSADIEVPYPESLQSYNRYSYVQNNPLSRLDLSGFADIQLIAPTDSAHLGGTLLPSGSPSETTVNAHGAERGGFFTTKEAQPGDRIAPAAINSAITAHGHTQGNLIVMYVCFGGRG